MKRITRWLAAISLSASACTFATAQDYPARTVALVVPSGPGGGTDIIARHMAQRLGELWKTAVVVENRPGAGSLVGTDHVARAKPDGHTVLVGGLFNMVMNKALIKSLPHDPLRDFTPVGYTSAYPFVLLVNRDLPVTDLRGFVDYAKARPGKLTYGSGGIGALQHVWGAILTKRLGLDMVHVPFKSGPLAVQDVIAGRVDITFDNLSATRQYPQSGKLRALGVSGTTRSPHLPDVPTINESGLAEFVGESWFGLFVPATTPAPIVGKLRDAITSIIRESEFQARIQKDGGRVLDIPADQQVKFLQDEDARWIPAVRDAKVTID